MNADADVSERSPQLPTCAPLDFQILPCSPAESRTGAGWSRRSEGAIPGLSRAQVQGYRAGVSLADSGCVQARQPVSTVGSMLVVL